MTDNTYTGNLAADCEAAMQADKIARAIRRAQEDFRAGCGQDDNPYGKSSQPRLREAWAWEMHRLWAEDDKAANASGRAIALQDPIDDQEKP